MTTMFCRVVATFEDDQVEKQLGVNEAGMLYPVMPLGPEYDDYRMTIHVRVIDSLGGAAEYNVSQIRVTRVLCRTLNRALYRTLYIAHDNPREGHRLAGRGRRV